jgi:hypothetical protein
MRPTSLALSLLIVATSAAAAQEAEPAGKEAGTPFWRAPRTDLDLRSLSPATVKLLAVPDRSLRFALLQVDDIVPTDNFVPGNPELAPFLPVVDAGYSVEPSGLKAGALPYGDRKYKIRELPDTLSGLTLLRTKMGNKSILDGRFSVVLSVTRPCYVFVAIDERALKTYTEHGTPSWLQEFAPTGHTITTDDPIMADVRAGYQVFVRPAHAGRVALGPPSMDWNYNAMYFAFFAEAKDGRTARDRREQSP